MQPSQDAKLSLLVPPLVPTKSGEKPQPQSSEGAAAITAPLSKLSLSQVTQATGTSPLPQPQHIHTHTVTEVTPPRVQTAFLHPGPITQRHLHDLLDIWREWKKIDGSTGKADHLNEKHTLPGSGVVFTPLGNLGNNSVCFTVKWPDPSLPNELFLKISRDHEAGRSSSQRRRAKQDAQQEIKMYAKLNLTHPNLTHPNLTHIVAPLAGGQVRDTSFLLMEKAEDDAFNLMSKQLENDDEPSIKYNFKAALHLTRAVAYLHSQGLVHRDIKTLNFFRFYDDVWRLGDLANTETPEKLTEQNYGSHNYIAPECSFVQCSWALNQNHTMASDVWSVGMALLELLHINESGEDCPAWIDEDEKVQAYATLKDFYNIYNHKNIKGKTLGTWMRELTGGYYSFLKSSSLPPYYQTECSAPWNVQLAIVAMAALRHNPAHRPSAQYIQNCLEDAAIKLKLEPEKIKPVSV